MSMTRYEFEVLCVLESVEKPSSVRDICDSSGISNSTVTKCINELLRTEKIRKSGTSYEITDRGIEALEPYRVRKAIILAAGFGSRMMPATADRPKPMVTVNGVRIIDTLLDALIAAEISDITIVRGYKKDKFDELLAKYPFITMVDNDDYDKSNNISSVILALDKLKDGCYLCEADLYISNPHIITKYQYVSNILGSYSLETDDWSFKLDKGHICDYQKGNTYCYNYYGISYWTPEDCQKLTKDFKLTWNGPNGHEYFWEFVPLVLRKEKYSVEIRQCSKQDIMEIDNYYELAQLDPKYMS